MKCACCIVSIVTILDYIQSNNITCQYNKIYYTRYIIVYTPIGVV